MKGNFDHKDLKEATPVENFDDWRGVWVIAEVIGGQLRDVTRELLGAARPMAEKLGVPVTAVVLGHELGDIPAELGSYGADAVLAVDHPTLRTPLARPSADVLTNLINERKPEVILIGATHTGRDVSSRIAVYVEAGMTADCTELDVEPASRELLARRPAFGGKMLATIRCDRHRPQMATARPGIFVPLERDTGRKVPVEVVPAPVLDERSYAAEVLDYIVHEGIDITKCDVLVGGGLGVGAKGFAKLEELAKALGGEVACTRPVADNGWMERSRQIGQTGISVRPKLYIAVGISGAIQHIEGMKESGTVVAINQDPNAPMFQYADLGLVGHWEAHVDALIAAATEAKLAGKKWMLPKVDSLADDRAAALERAVKAGKAAPAPAAPAPAAAPAAQEATPAAAPAPAQEQAPEAPAAPAPEPVEEAPAGPAKFEGDVNNADEVRAFTKTLPEELKAWVVADDCIVCNGCEAACPTGAAVVGDIAQVDRTLCISDGGCLDACPTDAIRLGVEDPDRTSGAP